MRTKTSRVAHSPPTLISTDPEERLTTAKSRARRVCRPSLNAAPRTDTTKRKRPRQGEPLKEKTQRNQPDSGHRPRATSVEATVVELQRQSSVGDRIDLPTLFSLPPIAADDATVVCNQKLRHAAELDLRSRILEMTSDRTTAGQFQKPRTQVRGLRIALMGDGELMICVSAVVPQLVSDRCRTPVLSVNAMRSGLIPTDSPRSVASGAFVRRSR
jgi:hypothetical protein